MTDDSSSPTTLTIEPVVSWPREVRPGGRYELTVDVHTAADAGAWPFPHEEVTIHLQLFCPPGIVPTLLTEPAIVLHRFGGTYGPARYMVTADDEVTSGDLRLVLSNRSGVPFHVATLAVSAAPRTPAIPKPEEAPARLEHLTAAARVRRATSVQDRLVAAATDHAENSSRPAAPSPAPREQTENRAEPEVLRFRRPDGSPTVWEVEMAPGPALETRNFRTRYGRYRNAPLAIRYAIGGEAAELALENAVGTGLRMLRRFGVDRIWPWEENPPRYPRELSRLVGFDVDHDAPFSITLEFGRPLAGWQSSGVPAVLSSPDDLRAFASGLVRGLAMLDRLGVVHRQILDNTVHWDARSRRVQINRFEYARREGEPRGRLARVRQPEERTARDWEAPEQILGGGLIDPRDDVFSVGCAILSMTAHGLSLGPDGLPDLSASGVPWLAYVLDGVFDPVDTRPTAADLLRRLGKSIARDDLPTREPDIFQEGRTEYDRIVARRDPQRSLAPRSALLRPVPITDDAPSPPWPPRNVPDRPTRPARRSSRRRPGPQR